MKNIISPLVIVAVVTISVLIFGQLPVFAKEPLADYLNTLTPPDRRNGIISPSASVTIVTFEDYQCEACAHTHKILKQLKTLYPGRLNFIFRHYPLVDQHPNALKAAVAVEAAAEQGKFTEMHDKLLENQSEWINKTDPTGDFKRYGDLFGPLTIPDTFERDFEEIMKRIKQDEADAKKLGVQGTPTTFVNGRNIGYVDDADVIKKEIEKDILPVSISIKFSPETTGVKTPTLTVTNAGDATSGDLNLPIKITYESEGVTKEQTIPNNPSTVCQDASNCSISVPIDFTVTNTGDTTSGTINLPGDPNNWKVTAYDPSGQEIAIYNGGIGSQDALWYWKFMEEQRKQEEENPFSPTNPQYIFFIIFVIALAILAWWKFRKR